MGQHSSYTNDPVLQIGLQIHPPGWAATNAQRLAYTTSFLSPSVQWFETDTGLTYQWSGTAWQNIGTSGQFFTIGNQRTFRSTLDLASTNLTVVTTSAYFAYLGTVVSPITPAHVEGWCAGTSGTWSQAEVGLFSSPLVPNRTAQVMTLIASGNTSFGINSRFSNLNAFNTSIPAGTNLWVGLRTSASPVPVLASLSNDYGDGYALTAVAGQSFAISTSYVTTIPNANSGTGVVIDLRAILD